MAEPSLRIAAISLHTSPTASPGSADAGGMNVVILEQARALARRGHRVDLLTRRTDPSAPAVVEIAEGLRLIHLDAGPAAPLAKSDMEQAIAPFARALAARLDGADGDYDVLHAHHWFSGVATLDATPVRRIPLLQSFHSVAAPAESTDLGAGEPAESAGRIAGERRAAREADLVVAVSDGEAATVRERYGVDPRRIVVIRPGVDIDAFHPPHADPADPAEPGPPRLLFAARLQPLKGPDLAIEVLAALEPSRGARLILAGGASQDDADEPARLRDLADRLGVADRVELRGAVDRTELAALLRGADVLLLTSWSETFGLVALEAQASATPVIAWRGARGVTEAVGPGGIVLEDRDPAAWARAVERILADADGRAHRARDARAFAEHRTWDASAAGLESAYRDLLAAPDPEIPRTQETP